MGVLTAGQVVVLPFPYSDLSGQKFRPGLLLASSGREDWIACQITSNPVADRLAIELTPAGFTLGGLRRVSYIRPGKQFTAHESLVLREEGVLTAALLAAVRSAAISIIRPA